MKTSVPRREIKMYTLLSTFPLHDTTKDSSPKTSFGRKPQSKYGDAAADVIAKRFRLRRNNAADL